ncbi:Dps DNA-binding ferritin-like protein (oxidative damage protectant) [uncultured Caudovirales phage]|uniref:Dps DNA-binding ferritin-like protein (Oxidative damage protectant) n=1 Tax=uncultured Caudovirales phage TaxID=2100421 RepID=A0A6J7WX02_9CAUD|nr:Dps DNA-binding ferritin-like protein (oxidative damage protectant) [uncultured Caudovirales phage]
MTKLINSLKVLMSDVVTMYFVAHGYHWNVEGQDFSQYHALFEDVYSDVYSSIDPIAENLRKLDAYAPFTLSKFTELRTVESAEVKAEPRAMAKALIKVNDGVLESLKSTFKIANEDANEQGIANFIAERIDMHQKWAWQLKASTK